MPSLSSVTDTVTNTEYINQKRSAQFNVYQEKRYAAYLDILKYFTIYCVILLVLAILRKRMILSYGFVNLLTLALVVGGGIHMYLKIANINNRNNMNFDEFDWSFNEDNQSDPNKLDTNLHEESTTGGATCVEEACCDTDATKWCESAGLCILKVSECEVETTNAINGGVASTGAASTGGGGYWNNYSCTFPSREKCKNHAFPYYCPGDNKCYGSNTSENCSSDDDSKLWCPDEGMFKSSMVGCASSPCGKSTDELHAKCSAGQLPCEGSDPLKCVNKIDECGEKIPPGVKCGLKSGDEHSSCTYYDNHHEEDHVSGFISNIAESFSYFKKSMNNIPKKEEKTNIGSFSDAYSSYASV